MCAPYIKSYDLWPDSEAETVKRHNSESETDSEFCVPFKISTESETILWPRDSIFRVRDERLGKPWPPTT